MLDLRYLAALVDGEGSIGVHRQVHRRATNPSFKVRLRVSNQSRILMDALVDSYGGSVYKSTRCFEWCVWSRQALALIEAILPHLVIKGEQARTALEFRPLIWQRHATHPVTPQEHAQRVQLYERMKALNARGAI